MDITRASFSDLDAMVEALAAWDMEFFPLAKAKSAGIVGSFVQIFGREYSYGFSAFASGLQMFGAPPQNMITFNIMEPTPCRYRVRGMDIGDETIWVFPTGSELKSCSPPGFQVHTVSVSEHWLDLICEATGMNPPTTSRRRETFTLPPESLFLLRQKLRTLRDDVAENRENSIREILFFLVPVWLGKPLSRNNEQPSMRARDMAVSRCLDLFESSDLGSLSTGSLSRACNVSERTLQYAFQERFSLSPADFLKSRRLSNVRRALLSGQPGEESVGDIAAMSGFWHFGQFSVDYKKLFGESPSQTLRRAC